MLSRKKRVPDGFLIPSQPTLSEKAPSGPNWIHELKFDGWRLVARKFGSRVKLWTRHGNDVTAHFSGISAAISVLPIDNALIDGEAIIFRPDGHSDFHALLDRSAAAGAVMVAFDLIEHEEHDLRRLPVEDRRQLLSALIGEHPGLMFSQEIPGDGPTIFEHACRLGAEGIISKRRGSSYRSGRVDTWRKTKFNGYARR